jgi:hypothetical protein
MLSGLLPSDGPGIFDVGAFFGCCEKTYLSAVA